MPVVYGCGVYSSQLIRYSRVSHSCHDFKEAIEPMLPIG